MSDQSADSGEGSPEVINSPPPKQLPGAVTTRLVLEAVKPGMKSLEDKINRNFRMGLAAVAFLLAAFAGGFLYLDSKADGVNGSLDNKIDRVNSDLGNKIDAVNESLGDKIEAVNGNLSDKVDAANLNLVKIETQLQDLIARIPAPQTSIPTK